MEDLERETVEAEQVEPTAEKEQAKPTEPDKEPTVSVTETEEFRHELQKALGKSTQALNAQVTISKQETAATKSEMAAIKASLAKKEEDAKFLEGKLDNLASDRFTEDPETLRGYKDELKRELEWRRLDAEKDRLKLIEVEQEGFRQAYALGEKSNELKAKYQIPKGVLDACTSAEQMEAIAKAFPEIEEKKPEKEKPKFDSGRSSTAGLDLDGATARELIQHGIDKARQAKNK